MNTLNYIIKKWNLKPGRRIPVDIPDMGRHELALLFCELGFIKGAEIGVLEAKYSRELCLANPNLKLYCIDPWLNYPEFRTAGKQSDYDAIYENVKKTALPGMVIIRKKSMDAVKDFEDNSIDFVYVDGNHEFTSEANDIHEWSKKVRPGGIISGHDYAHYYLKSYSHSYEVVNAYTWAYRIDPWFVIGRNKDRIRSWFWVKR